MVANRVDLMEHDHYIVVGTIDVVDAKYRWTSTMVTSTFSGLTMLS